MFHTLLESRALVVDRSRRWTVVSASVHAAIVTAALALTLSNGRDDVRSDPPIYVPVIAPAPPSRPATPPMHATGPVTTTLPTVPPLHLPDLSTFKPTVDVDPRVLSHRTEDWQRTPSPHRPAPAPGSVLTADHVDRQVVPQPGNGQPRYPDVLRASSVEGDVVARFVVDTLGRVEPGSVAILAATHALFAAEVRTWLARTRYRPAEFEGRTVRQLVEQRIGFALRR
jgi:hypothetical protein